MLNMFQHPFRPSRARRDLKEAAANCASGQISVSAAWFAHVAKWTLKRVQGDEKGVRRAR
jgi:hypothetical protein